MSQFRTNEVWTEREAGDWEACVSTSYAMGLLYGGVTMPAPYTKAERERLEVTADEPQTLGLTDGKALAVYGHKLRPPSVSAGFLSRPGMGFCLTGTGSPGGYQAGTFTHEVFAVAESVSSMLLYDPLAPAGGPPKRVPTATLAAWAKGFASYQAREVRKDEFMADRTVNAVLFLGADGKPALRSISFLPGKTVVGYALDGSSEKFVVGAAGSSAPADARCSIVSGNNPKGPGWIRITAGAFADHPFLAEAQDGIKVPEDPPIGGGITEDDVEKAHTLGKIQGANDRDAVWVAHLTPDA